MITLFISPSCTSCRKAKRWLEQMGIPFKERNIFSNPLTIDELKKLLAATENGTEDLISTRSKVFQKIDTNFDDLSINQLLSIVAKNPSILRRPLIMDERRLQIGFNDDEIRTFLPRSVRKLEMKEAQLKAETGL
ncbi:MAG: transcriptional regulator Spx [Streptococcaceae bacterium]|jgi:regulatory protein spx|nr:transcriptional regulator Spx [Streptococcaceae bacterium]